MSTLNTFGFSVRRKRNQPTHSPAFSKQEKTSTPPILAFAAPAPPSFSTVSKPEANAPIKKTNTKSKTNKQQLPKDPKQSTLLPFFTTSLPTASTSSSPSQDQQPNNEENQICLVKRHMTMNELLPMLMDTFGEYSNDRIQQGSQQNTLQIKPNKTMVAIQSEGMDFAVENDLVSTRRRRRSCYDVNENGTQDDETETLRTAFTKSLSLVPMKKRLCGSPSTNTHQHISALFENGQERHMYTLEDELSNDDQESNEIPSVRRHLSPGQVNSLLLEIANEYLVFENNSWCASYIGL